MKDLLYRILGISGKTKVEGNDDEADGTDGIILKLVERSYFKFLVK